MYIDYKDILSRIAEPPKWWLYGVPRYDDFRPNDLNIYCKEALLVHIKCQYCSKDFHIGLFNSNGLQENSFRRQLTYHRQIHVGDPPNACCSPGNCATSEEIAVLQFWERNNQGWQRVPELERGLWIGDLEFIELHQEAWRRIRVYEARKAGSRPEWKPLSSFNNRKEKLPERFLLSLKNTGSYKNLHDLRERYILLSLATTGRITHEEFIELEQLWVDIRSSPSDLEGMNQEQVINHVRKMLSSNYKGTEEFIKLREKQELYKSRQALEPPEWANKFIEEYDVIEDLILSQGVDGYEAMNREEREEQYCSSLSKRLLNLAHTGRITQEEYHPLISMLRVNSWA